MYKPTDIDVAWAHSVIRLIKDGGSMVYPGPGLVYTLHHERKLIVLTNPEMTLDNLAAFFAHLQTMATFHKVGWQTAEMWEGGIDQ